MSTHIKICHGKISGETRRKLPNGEIPDIWQPKFNYKESFKFATLGHVSPNILVWPQRKGAQLAAN